MKTSVKLVIFSHLSDIEESQTDAHTRIQFIKWLLIRYPDTTTEINPDKEMKLFLKSPVANR